MIQGSNYKTILKSDFIPVDATTWDTTSKND